MIRSSLSLLDRSSKLLRLQSDWTQQGMPREPIREATRVCRGMLTAMGNVIPASPLRWGAVGWCACPSAIIFLRLRSSEESTASAPSAALSTDLSPSDTRTTRTSSDTAFSCPASVLTCGAWGETERSRFKMRTPHTKSKFGGLHALLWGLAPRHARNRDKTPCQNLQLAPSDILHTFARRRAIAIRATAPPKLRLLFRATQLAWRFGARSGSTRPPPRPPRPHQTAERL